MVSVPPRFLTFFFSTRSSMMTRVSMWKQSMPLKTTIRTYHRTKYLPLRTILQKSTHLEESGRARRVRFTTIRFEQSARHAVRVLPRIRWRRNRVLGQLDIRKGLSWKKRKALNIREVYLRSDSVSTRVQPATNREERRRQRRRKGAHRNSRKSSPSFVEM